MKLENTYRTGYKEFDIFKKTKQTDPEMGVKWNSKTHLQNTFFGLLSRFVRVWLQNLQSLRDLNLKICFKIRKGFKNAKFHADFKSVKKVFKRFTNKRRQTRIKRLEEHKQVFSTCLGINFATIMVRRTKLLKSLYSTVVNC
jgi:hypothetical protein